jgi:hypothetical protein
MKMAIKRRSSALGGIIPIALSVNKSPTPK